jgi:T-complex protein 1 subunit delta
MEVRLSNMTAAKAISDAVRTSLGPKGMDKMVSKKGLVGNDRAPHLPF